MFNALLYIVIALLVLPIHAGWYNWAGNHYCNPTFVENPTTKNELINAIKRASRNNHTVCIVGACHSFSEIACGNDHCISMQRLNKILTVDTTRMQVRVEGGIVLKAFNEHIAQYGLALPNLPAMCGMTLAGALCTATHGTGNTGTLSSFITHIELITADGTVHNLSAEQTPEEFKAACTSLGSLGVIYSITMQCEPLFILEYYEAKETVDNTIANYKKLLKQSDYFQCRWQLLDDIVCLDFWHRIPLDKITSYSPNLVKKLSYEALQWDINTEPGMASEIAIPIDLFPQAIPIIRELVNRWSARGLKIDEVICRFVKADTNSYLSPAAYRDVVYINIGTEAEAQYYDFFKDFEEAMYLIQGRPHWGKVNFLNKEMAYSLYGDDLIKFIKIKHKFDPDNVFSNVYLDQILN